MINKILEQLVNLAEKLKNDIDLDIIDVKAANHSALLDRNKEKLDSMEQLTSLKKRLNDELAKEFHSGGDISIYREKVDNLEVKLKELYQLNGKLASIVLPVKDMYQNIIDDIKNMNGGSLVEVVA